MIRTWHASVVLLALAAVAFVGTPEGWSSPESAVWSGDTVHSHVLFKTKHLGTSMSYGRFNDFTVSLTTNDAGTDLTGAQFAVRAASVDTGNAKRDQHLQSPDFLSAKQFEEITFKSTSVKPSGNEGWDVSGDLTLHGVTKPITVKVHKIGAGKGMKGEDLLGVETTFTVKRSDYGMTNMVGPVGDEVTITVAVEAMKKQD
jgi:polyisoprenoid-binding protein YceI